MVVDLKPGEVFGGQQRDRAARLLPNDPGGEGFSGQFDRVVQVHPRLPVDLHAGRIGTVLVGIHDEAVDEMERAATLERSFQDHDARFGGRGRLFGGRLVAAGCLLRAIRVEDVQSRDGRDFVFPGQAVLLRPGRILFFDQGYSEIEEAVGNEPLLHL